MNTQITSIRERRARWQAAHRLLFRDDPQFRKRHIRFLITVVCLSIPLLGCYSYYFGFGSFAAILSVIVCVTATMIYLSLRHLHFVNQRIEGYLQSNHDA